MPKIKQVCKNHTIRYVNMLETLKNLKNLIIVSGHFGAGKTNFAVNLAKAKRNAGFDVTLMDLDIVNPYFRAADNVAELEALGIRCIVPDFANTNVDIPSLPPTVLGALEAHNRESGRVTIIDVGGDNGAVALGMYNRFFKDGEYELLYVLNKYRPLTEDTNGAEMILREIEYSGRLRATGVVNNSNLGRETTVSDITDTHKWASEFADHCELPLICTCADSSFLGSLSDIPDVFFIENATKQIF